MKVLCLTIGDDPQTFAVVKDVPTAIDVLENVDLIGADEEFFSAKLNQPVHFHTYFGDQWESVLQSMSVKEFNETFDIDEFHLEEYTVCGM